MPVEEKTDIAPYKDYTPLNAEGTLAKDPELNHIMENNCLIFAIGDALGILIHPHQVVNIRTLLASTGHAAIGTMLDAANDEIRGIILLMLNLKPDDYIFQIYNQTTRNIDVFPQSPLPPAPGKIPINIVYTGNHFFA